VKNKVIVISIIVAVSLIGKLQAKELHMGLKGGLNIANFTGDEEFFVYKSKMGIILGGYVSYPINNSIVIQPELLYTMKGSEREVVGIRITESLNYLEIPILLKLMLVTEENMKLNLFLGPAVSVTLSAKAKIDYPKDVEDLGFKDEEKDSSNYKKKYDIGIVIGGGIDFNSGLVLDIRYGRGITKIGAKETYIDMYNSVISFMVGYRFN